LQYIGEREKNETQLQLFDYEGSCICEHRCLQVNVITSYKTFLVVEYANACKRSDDIKQLTYDTKASDNMLTPWNLQQMRRQDYKQQR
jgi:hypothetical protein